MHSTWLWVAIATLSVGCKVNQELGGTGGAGGEDETSGSTQSSVGGAPPTTSGAGGEEEQTVGSGTGESSSVAVGSGGFSAVGGGPGEGSSVGTGSGTGGEGSSVAVGSGGAGGFSGVGGGGSGVAVGSGGAGGFSGVGGGPDTGAGGASQACGGIAGLACADGAYCVYDDPSCDTADGMGTCHVAPACDPDAFDPVCGCDGVTYANVCAVAQAHASIAHDGPCSPDACGGLAGLPCDAGKYCRYADGSCGVGDDLGACLVVPDDCPTDEFDPVCGCDGTTYVNDCYAGTAQVSLSFLGECP